MNGNIRTISFTPTDRFYAKNTCDMPGVIPIPVLINEKKEIVGNNNFFTEVIDNYHHRIAQSLENNRKLEELKELIYANVEEVTDAESANRYMEWVKGLEHVYNSKVIAGRALKVKADQLNLKFDKQKSEYTDGSAA